MADKRPKDMTPDELAALPLVPAGPREAIAQRRQYGDFAAWEDDAGRLWSFEEMPDGSWARKEIGR